MKVLLIPILFMAILPGFSQDSLRSSGRDRGAMEFMHISTEARFDTTQNLMNSYEAMSIVTDSSTLIVLSLVDADGSIIKNWDKFTAKYTDRNYLIVVTNTDNENKLNFMNYFYRQRLNGLSLEKAYEITSEQFKDTVPKLYHFMNLLK